MLNYAHRYDPNIASTFTKLNSIVPLPLREQIQKTMDLSLIPYRLIKIKKIGSIYREVRKFLFKVFV